MSSFNLSPPKRTDWAYTIPDREITAISVVPPPISTIILPTGSWTSRPIPIAAAIGSSTRYTSFAPACSALSRTALRSTSVIPLGTQITICRVVENHLTLTFFIIPRIICSATSKSAITPSLSGLIVRIFLCVRSCINLAS